MFMKLSLSDSFKKLHIWIYGLMTVGVLGTAGVIIYIQIPQDTTEKNLKAQTVPVETKDWVIQIQANGVVQAVRRINLSPEDSGKIAKLLVNEGDTVTKGQVIALMTSDRLQAQVNQYKAILLKAEADLAQKRSGNRPEEVAQAQARLVRVEAELQQVKNSAPQEINQAQAQVQAASARVQLAEVRLKRNQLLAQEGAIALDKLNEIEAEFKTARANLEEAQLKLEQLQASKRQEVAQRQAATEEAKQALRQSLNGTRPKEITQAEAEVEQVKAQLAFYQSQLNSTIIRAPFAGVITRRFAQEGDFVSPSTSASSSEGASSTSITELSNGLEIEAKIPEANISKIQIGQKVDIKTDTYLNEVFQGKVKLMAPRAVQENNITSFRVKVGLTTGNSKLKSGMNVRLSFKSEPIKNALVIPLAAVVTQANGQTGVYVPDVNAQTRFQQIKVSSAGGDKVSVLAGLKSGDQIFIAPPNDQKIEGVDTVNVEY